MDTVQEEPLCKLISPYDGSGRIGFFLELAGVTTMKELIRKFVRDRKYKRFQPDDFNPKKKPYWKYEWSDLHDFNMEIARFLHAEKYISKEEVHRQMPIMLFRYMGGLQTRTARVLAAKKNIRTLGTLIQRCINEDGSFHILKRDGAGQSVNYDTAKFLRDQKYLSEEEFAKVPLPYWKFRIPTDEEIGRSGEIPLTELPWAKEDIGVIETIASYTYLDRFEIRSRWMHFEKLQVSDLVKLFVKIDRDNMPVLKDRGHVRQARFYYRNGFLEQLDAALVQIRKNLEKLGYLGAEKNEEEILF